MIFTPVNLLVERRSVTIELSIVRYVFTVKGLLLNGMIELSHNHFRVRQLVNHSWWVRTRWFVLRALVLIFIFHPEVKRSLCFSMIAIRGLRWGDELFWGFKRDWRPFEWGLKMILNGNYRLLLECLLVMILRGSGWLIVICAFVINLVA